MKGFSSAHTNILFKMYSSVEFKIQLMIVIRIVPLLQCLERLEYSRFKLH